MAKINFTKLGLKKKSDVKTIKFNDIEIEVLQYLPIQDKLALISKVINLAHEDKGYPNPVKLEVIGAVEMVCAYTNLKFTEKQLEDVPELYDAMESNGFIDAIISAIPCTEYDFVVKGIDDTIKGVYDYQNSVYGILDGIATDYKDLEFDATEIQKALGDKEGMAFLKNIIDKTT